MNQYQAIKKVSNARTITLWRAEWGFWIFFFGSQIIKDIILLFGVSDLVLGITGR
jgi:hypothetical protein